LDLKHLMPKPFKFRYVNEIVGSFVLVVVLVLASGIILAGKAQDWFIEEHEYILDLPPEGSLGLKRGSDVEILGTTVGRIESIRIRTDGSMLARIVVKGDFYQFIREDSEAIAKKRYQVAGDTYIEITKGKGAILPDDAMLTVLKDTEILEIASEILNQIQQTTVPALEQLQKAMEEYTALAADLRNPEGPLLKLFANLEQITAGLQKGEGSAGKILRDPELANQLSQILGQVSESLVQVQAVLDDVKKTTGQLPPMAERVGNETKDLPGLVLQTQETLREAERLIEGIQQTWLVRGYIAQPETGRLIKPSEVAAP
jgi:phospholipid/cholesterol/gamma-HCH transport system substrate-binding protein